MTRELTDYDLLIVSDLHLSEGRNPTTKKFSPNEDFFFDEEFARFLAYFCDEGRWPGKKWHLIINGDFLDFLQVTTIMGAPPELSRDPDRPGYGLGCGAAETVFKLKIILDGHWLFFEALAEFIAAGHMVTIGKGNHDVEFHYTEVREAFRRELRQLYAKKLDRENDPDKANKLARMADDSIRFMDWFYYEKGQLWVEHGNQYDQLNCFKYWLAPLLPEIPGWDSRRRDEIDLPWGSLFVRYLFNKVEKDEPFADNIKPQTKFITWFLRTHPGLAIRFIFGDGRYMLKKMRRAWEPLPAHAYARREEEHRALLTRLGEAWGIPHKDLESIDDLREPSVLKGTISSLRWRVFRFLIRHQLLLPLCAFSILLVLVVAFLFLAPLFARLVPDSIRWLLWGRWSITLAGQIVHWAVKVVRGLFLPVLVLLIAWFVKWFLSAKLPNGLSYLAERASRIRPVLNVRYVIMGHTHDTDLQPLGLDGHEYFNTGTWTKVFSKEEQLIREESELAFVLGLRRPGGLKVKLLKWDDPANQPRLVKLFG